MDPRSRGREPPPEVLAAWGVENPVALDGGQGGTFAADHLVLKPVVDEAEAIWLADTLTGLAAPAAFRLIRPVRTNDGRWVVGGWAAWERLAGKIVAGRWRDAFAAADHFHRHVSAAAGPPPSRDHPWAVGDRYAWGEEDLDVPGELGEIAARLVSERRSVDLPDQLIHGDLLNNLLFDDVLPPAVIDVSPYWRPARYAKAIIVIDAVGWEGAGAQAAMAFGDDVGRQLLLRAILFRLASAIVLVGGDTGRLPGQAAVYERLEGLLNGPPART